MCVVLLRGEADWQGLVVGGGFGTSHGSLFRGRGAVLPCPVAGRGGETGWESAGEEPCCRDSALSSAAVPSVGAFGTVGGSPPYDASPPPPRERSRTLSESIALGV